MPPDWKSEDIPDADTLFRRVHRQYAPNGILQPGAFNDIGGGMSSHWQKYCPTAADARNRSKSPHDNGVVSLQAGTVRTIPLEVNHAPARKDRSHTTVLGEKTAAVRAKLLKISAWEIEPEAP